MGCKPSKLVYKTYVADGFDRHPKFKSYVLVPKTAKNIKGYNKVNDEWVQTGIIEEDNLKLFIAKHCTIVKFLVDGRIVNMPVLNIDVHNIRTRGMDDTDVCNSSGPISKME